MNEDILNDIDLEKSIEQQFALRLDINNAIVRNVTCGTTSQAIVFKTAQNTHYLYVTSQSTMTLGEIKKIVHAMGLEADEFIVPRGDADYFKRIGVEKFKQMFPGKYIMSDGDTSYYETLASYNPALIRLARIKGEIRAYNIAAQKWRKVKDYAYTKMNVI